MRIVTGKGGPMNMPTRRELFQKTAKAVWIAPAMTTVLRAFDTSRITSRNPYTGFYTVTRLSEQERYADFCDAGCQEAWKERGYDRVPDVFQNVGALWGYYTKWLRELL